MNGVRAEPAFDPAQCDAAAVAAGCSTRRTRAVTEATAALEAYRFDEYAPRGYRFVWNSFCDWFLEFAKPVFAEGRDAAEAAEIARDGGACVRRDPASAASRRSRSSRRSCGIVSVMATNARLIRAAWPTPSAVPDAEAARG